jgi:hypothetical protein
MGFFDRLRFRCPRRAEVILARKCEFCSDPVKAKASLEDLGVAGPENCYLLRCPKCGQYWGGYAYTPQYLWALSPEEVTHDFPGIFGPG